MERSQKTWKYISKISISETQLVTEQLYREIHGKNTIAICASRCPRTTFRHLCSSTTYNLASNGIDDATGCWTMQREALSRPYSLHTRNKKRRGGRHRGEHERWPLCGVNQEEELHGLSTRRREDPCRLRLPPTNSNWNRGVEQVPARLAESATQAGNLRLSQIHNLRACKTPCNAQTCNRRDDDIKIVGIIAKCFRKASRKHGEVP